MEDLATVLVDTFGDHLTTIHNDDIVHIMTCNINGLPYCNSHPKNDQLCQYITRFGIDIFGLLETNIHWPSIPLQDRWEEHCATWWETSSSVVAFNTHDPAHSRYQPGGVMMTSINKAAHRIIKRGQDPSGLGRWIWTLYRGRHNVTLKVIVAY